jgi:hypothetical protein
MKHIKKFNETKDEKVKDQEVLFNAEVLADKDENPSFKTEVEDQEKVQKEFDKLRGKVEKFENFTIEIEVKPEGEEYCEEEPEVLQGPVSQEVGCGCCDDCTGQSDCQCCDDCTCGAEEEANPETEVKVMNMSDFMNSIAGQ